MIKNLKFNLPDGHAEKQFIGQLAEQYRIKKERTGAERVRICDTFDWRLFNKSLILYSSGSRLFLRKLAKSEILHSIEFGKIPVFIWDFPAGELKERLAPIIKMRALLHLVKLQSITTSYRILNPDEKTVARLVFEEIHPPRKKRTTALAKHLWLKPVKGYPKYARNLVKQIEAAGFTLGKADDIYFKSLAAVDKKPGSYSAKVNIRLDPAMRSDQAAKVVLRFLLNVMRINEAIFEKDLDTEVLHDFRVAIRRTRSALAQIKNVFPARTTDRFKKDFAFVGKRSNALRDLDVYLLKQDAYKAMLPDVLRNDIDPLFRHLRKKRAKAFQHVVRFLKSKKYAKIIKDWKAFLNKPPPDPPTASNAELPVIELARQRIYKKYRGVVKTGSSILANIEDKMLHALRIECKKLRYLMEFFASLFPRKKINALIGQLKNLQDNLGDFNDLCIQQEYLLNVVAELPASQQQVKKTLVAIGSLIEALDHEKHAVKEAFARTFTDFAAPENQALFQALFSSKDSPG
ncbi:MAG: CHAD domain-containing protein [Desulfobacterales bacterium]|jgi:CHAD domain-containing protein